MPPAQGRRPSSPPAPDRPTRRWEAIAELEQGRRNPNIGRAHARTCPCSSTASWCIPGRIAASSCCILPLVLFSVGVGGAWIGNLTALAPYQPIFIAITLGFLAASFYLVYLRPKRACAAGEACAWPVQNRVTKTSLWVATVLVAAALAFPYVGPTLLGV